MDHFPSELLSLVITHLTQPEDLYQCALINQLFYETSIPFLWRSLKIEYEAQFNTINACLLAATASHSPPLAHHVRHLYLGSYSTDAMLLFLMKHVPHVETLDIHRPLSLSTQTVNLIPQHCPHLKTIYFDSVHLSSQAVASLVLHCPLVDTITLGGTKGVTGDLFPALAPAATRLKEVNIVVRTLFGSNRPDWLTEVDASKGLHRLSSLIKLKLLGFSKQASIGSSVLQTPSAWPHLTHLSLTGCNGITTAQLDIFLQSHPGIIDLGLGGLFADIFVPVSRHLPGIQSLMLEAPHGDIQPQPLRQFIQQCSSLVYLSFGDHGHISYSKSDFPGVIEVDDKANGTSSYGEFLECALDTIRHVSPCEHLRKKKGATIDMRE